MKEVLRYLSRIRENILTIEELKTQHWQMIKAIEGDRTNYLKSRIDHFKKTNNEVSDIIVVEKYFSSEL